MTAYNFLIQITGKYTGSYDDISWTRRRNIIIFGLIVNMHQLPVVFMYPVYMYISQKDAKAASQPDGHDKRFLQPSQWAEMDPKLREGSCVL